MKAKYLVTIKHDGTNKQYYFESRKEAYDFMYKQKTKGYNPRNITILHLG